MSSKPSVQVGLRLKPQVDAELSEVAIQERRPKAEVVRLWIEDALAARRTGQHKEHAA